jgi:hypothetical protein
MYRFRFVDLQPVQLVFAAVRQVVPVRFRHVNAELFRGAFDALPGVIPFGVRYAFHLVEARDRVTNVGGIVQGLFLLFGKSKLRCAHAKSASK